MTYIVAIDPGSTTSGVATHDDGVWRFYPKVPNEALLLQLRGDEDLPGFPVGSLLLIEQARAIGATIGNETLDTVEWSGRFQEAHARHGQTVVMVPRQAVKSWHLNGKFKRDDLPKGTDARIRKVMLEKYGAVALKGCTTHAMQAAAVIAAWLEGGLK